MTESVGTENSYGKLGRDVGIVGRWVRLCTGGALAGDVIYHAALTPSTTAITKLALYFAATLGAYTAASLLLGRLFLAKMNTWMRTAVLLTPLAAVFAFQLGPHTFHHALLLYIGVSLIFSFFMRYGGCEVMSIPGLILRTRQAVYCPLNVIDAVEKAVVDRQSSEREPR